MFLNTVPALKDYCLQQMHNKRHWAATTRVQQQPTHIYMLKPMIPSGASKCSIQSGLCCHFNDCIYIYSPLRSVNSLSHENEVHPTSIVINVTTNIKSSNQKRDSVTHEKKTDGHQSLEEVCACVFLLHC